MATNVGTAKVTIEADFSNFQSDLDTFFGKSGKAAGKALDKGVSDGAAGAKKSAEGVADSAKKAAQDAGKAMDAVPKAAGKAGSQAAADFSAGVGGVPKAAQKAGQDAGAALDGVADAAGRAGQQATSRFSASVTGVSSSAQRAAQGAGEAMSGIGASGARAGSAAATGFSSSIAGVSSSASSTASRASESLAGIAGAGSTAGSRASTGFSSAIGGIVGATSSAASRAGQALQGVVSAASTAGAGVRDKLTSAFQSTHQPVDALPGKIGAIGGALAAVAGPMAMFKGGFDRLMNIQKAEIMFKNVGLSAQETSDYMAHLTDQITGTSVSLGDASKYAAMFAQSGVKMGKPMDDTITAFTNLAAAAEGSGVDVGRVLQQISAQGKVSGEDLMQFSDAGINAAQYLADSMGMSVADVRSAVSDGKVSFEDFTTAVNSGMGSFAKEMGETLPAKMSNFKTSVSNLGAAILEPLIGPFTTFVEVATTAFKSATKPVKAFFGAVQEGNPIALALVGVMGAIGATAMVGVAVGMFQAARAAGTLSKMLKILNLQFVMSGPGLIVLAIIAVVAAFVVLWKKCAWFRDFWKGLWDSITGAVSAAWEKVQPVFDTIKAAWDELTAAFSGGDWGYGALSSLFGEGAAQGIVNAMAGIGDAVRTTWEWVQKLAGVFASVGKSVAAAGLDTAKSLFSAVWAVVKSLFGAVVQIGKAFWDLAQVLAPVLWPVLKVIGIVVGGVLVGAFFALMGALKLVSGVVQVVATVIQWLAENVLSPLISVLGTVASFLIDVLGAAFQWLFDTVSTIASGLVTAFTSIWDFLVLSWQTVGQPVLDFIVAAFQFFWDALMLGFRLIGATFEVIWTGLGLAWTTFGQPILDLIVAAFRFLWSGVEVIFGWIMTGWNILWAGVRAVYDNVIKPVLDWISNAFQWVKDRISAAIGIIGDKIRQFGDWVSGMYSRYVQPMVDAVTGGFNRIKDTISGWKDKVVGVLSDAGSWLVDTGKNIVQGLLDGIGSLAGSIGNFFLDKIPGWIKGPFKKALGIHSPSRVFKGYGVNIGEGLVNGVKSMGGAVQKASQAMADKAGDVDMPTLSMDATVAATPASAPAAASAALPAAGGSGMGSAGLDAAMGATDPSAALTDAATTMQATADSILTPMWAQQNADMAMWGLTAQTQANTMVAPALTAVGATASSVNLSQWQPAMLGMASAVTGTAATTVGQANAVLNPALNSIGATSWGVLNGSVNPAMAGMRGAVANTADSFRLGADNIATQWNRVREATAAPARFAINTVFNDGIVGMWNSVSDLLGTQKMGTYPARFATGGYVRGPGGPKSDKIPALLSNKEYVLDAATTKRIGPENLRALQQGSASVAPGVLRNPQMRKGFLKDKTMMAAASRYQGGGLAEGTPAWKALLRGYNWARSRNGRPYVWGGSANGSGGADCSGFMSGIADVILGGDGARQWATMDFPGTQQGAWKPGLAAGFSVGISDVHTAGTIGGAPGIPAVNVESGGDNSRMKFGTPDAAGANHPQFNRRFAMIVTDGGSFVPGAGSGASMGDIVGGVMKPFRDKMKAATDGWAQNHPGIINTMPGAIREKLGDATQKKIDKLLEEMMADPGGAGAERWRPMAKRAMARTGFDYRNPAQVNAMISQIQSESSGDPNRAQEIVDINGTGESAGVGLLQIIPGTFAAHRDPALPNDRRNPFANMVAALRYYRATYGGDLTTMWGHGHGYDRGGLITEEGLFSKQTTKAERMLSPRQTQAFDELVDFLTGTGWQDFAQATGLQSSTVNSSSSNRTIEAPIHFHGPVGTTEAAEHIQDTLTRKVW